MLERRMRGKAVNLSRSIGFLQIGPPLLLGLAPLVFLGAGGEFENHPKAAFLQWAWQIHHPANDPQRVEHQTAKKTPGIPTGRK